MSNLSLKEIRLSVFFNKAIRVAVNPTNGLGNRYNKIFYNYLTQVG